MGAPTSDKAGVRQTYRTIKNAGLRVVVVDGAGEEFHNLTTEDEVIAEVMSCDDGYFIVFDGDQRIGFIWFVFGNDPEEVICDYATSLSYLIDPLTDGWMNGGE